VRPEDLGHTIQVLVTVSRPGFDPAAKLSSSKTISE